MTEPRIEIGTIVQHPKRPAWGPGKVLSVGGGGQVTVYFRDLVESKPGDSVKTISTSVVPLEVTDEQTDFMLENLPLFDGGKFKGMRKPRLSLDQAIATFTERKPDAFGGTKYIEQDRAPIMEAHQIWSEGFADGRGTELLNDGKIADIRKRLQKIDSKFSLLRPQEKTDLKHGLENDETAEPFIRALFAAADQGEPERASFQSLIDTVDQMVERVQGTRSTNWSALTQYLFIANPEQHLGFKPTSLQKCAARLNFDLHYSTAPNWWTYERLLELSAILKARLEPLGAKDMIDVHSFIEVIAAA